MTLLTVKVLFNLLGILLVCSFFFCSKFYQRVIWNKGCWILEWILFLFPVFTSFMPHVTFNVQANTGVKTQWWKRFSTDLSFETSGLTHVVLSTQFIPFHSSAGRRFHLRWVFFVVGPQATLLMEACQERCYLLLQVDRFQTQSHT